PPPNPLGSGRAGFFVRPPRLRLGLEGGGLVTQHSFDHLCSDLISLSLAMNFRSDGKIKEDIVAADCFILSRG
ncbi:hypothetical protein, partial [Phenylobacterium sp.]|uniref:hypothetical protein n=1 Tax=Phenylobacterium sp. TaxID=1871053 RepID=UPI002ED8913F